MKSTYQTLKFVSENRGLFLLGAITILVIFTVSADAGTHNPQ
jgi:hypothetical protein